METVNKILDAYLMGDITSKVRDKLLKEHNVVFKSLVKGNRKILVNVVSSGKFETISL